MDFHFILFGCYNTVREGGERHAAEPENAPAGKGVSQQRLADAIGVSQPSINKYENHNIEPEIEILKRIADYFDTSIDYIVGHTQLRHKIEPMRADMLNRTEEEILLYFRALTDEEKKCIENTMKAFLKNR